MLYVCVCVMCIPCYIPYTFFNGLVPQDALESDDSEDVWGTKWGASRFSYGSRIEQCSKMAMFFHPVDLNGIIWSIFDYIYIYVFYVSMLIFTAVMGSVQENARNRYMYTCFSEMYV